MMKKTMLKNTVLPGREYPNLDAARFLMALLVILIHARPFAEISPAADFLVSDMMARVAVPVFYAISGFLFFGKLQYTDGRIQRCAANMGALLRYLKRNTLVYLLWSGIYIAFSLPGWYQIGWWGIPMIKDCVINLIFAGSYYHLWFLLSIIYAVPLLFGLLTVVPKNKLAMIITAGWILECLVYSYGWILPDYPQPLAWLLSRIPIAFDACFRAVPLLGIGAMLIDYESADRRDPKAAFVLGSLIACGAEAVMLKLFSPNRTNFSYLITTPFMAYAVLRYLLTARQLALAPMTAARLRKSSLMIYCLHPMVIQLLAAVGIENGVLRSLLVIILSVFASVMWSYIQGTGNRMKP